MKHIIYFALIIGLAAGCKEPPKEKGTLTINFKALYDADPLVLYQSYATPDGDQIQFNILDFFISDIELVNDEGETITLSDHEYVNFSNLVDLSAASAGLDFTFTDIPVDDYTEIRFGVGVSSTLNAKDPADFDSSSELGNTGRYWTTWSSFIFSRIEGRLDTLSGAGGELAYFYHSGGDEMYQERSFTKNFTLSTSTNNLSFELQAKDIFYSSSAPIDITANNASHAAGGSGSEDFNLAMQTLKNIANALSIK